MWAWEKRAHKDIGSQAALEDPFFPTAPFDAIDISCVKCMIPPFYPQCLLLLINIQFQNTITCCSLAPSPPPKYVDIRHVPPVLYHRNAQTDL